MIRTITLVAAAFALLACGGQDTTGSAEADVAAQPGSGQAATGGQTASGGQAPTPSREATTATATGAATTSPFVASCLDLVAREEWNQAVSTCTRAAGVDPENNEVQRALDTAKARVAEGTASAAAKMAEGQEAADDAAASAAETKKNAEETRDAVNRLGNTLLGD